MAKHKRTCCKTCRHYYGKLQQCRCVPRFTVRCPDDWCGCGDDGKGPYVTSPTFAFWEEVDAKISKDCKKLKRKARKGNATKTRQTKQT